MKVYKEVNWTFILCSFLVLGGEIHRWFVTEDQPPPSSPTAPTVLTTSALQSEKFEKHSNNTKLIFPVSGKTRDHLIGKFGDPRGKNGERNHEGIDIAAKHGTPVIAAANGKVVKVKEGGNGGKQVWVKDDQRDWTYYYAHLQRQDVKEGQSVEKGDQVGTVGSTGNAPESAPHLHFSIYEPGMLPIDPLTVLP